MGEHGSLYSTEGDTGGNGGTLAVEDDSGKGCTDIKRSTFLRKGNKDDIDVGGANRSSTLGRGGSEF